MMRTKKTFLTIVAVFFAAVTSMLAGDDWLTSIPDAQKLAKKENKPLFIEFTGSDWCPPCIMMQKAVFSKKAFLKGAKKDFILVKIDIPNKDKALKKKNQKILDKYKVKGVPTVILMDAEGKEFSRFVASQFNTVDKMLEQLKKQLRMKDMF